MAGKTIDLNTIVSKDSIACELANLYISWENKRAARVKDWEEAQRYIFSTDTTTTSNASLPWKNKTVTPKLTQIRDNLFANYMASVFPKRKWLYWEALDKSSATQEKQTAIKSYMSNVIEQPSFKNFVRRALLDYIDYGNCIAGIEWVDNRSSSATGEKVGFVGPMPVRMSPLDVVFNPIADSFDSSPKIVRSLITIGELKKSLTSFANKDVDVQEIFNYCIKLRQTANATTGTLVTKDAFFNIAGFDNFIGYLNSNYVELLTCYGDFYDVINDKFYANSIVTIVDRHKVISIKTEESTIGEIPIYHCGWRIRQDNLWAQGPLENLVGLQYRIDHLENLKADVFDLIAAPPIAVYGLVHDFTWKPFERIDLGDEGKLEVLSPDVNALQPNLEIANIMNLMEEMAGSPKEAAGFRSPGEKTAYEVQRLENAASRIFYSKIVQFEEFLEKLLNGMLELARRKVDRATLVKTVDSETNVESFLTIMPEDLSANGKIRPIAARNFAEKAERIQNLTSFYSSAVGTDQDIKAHFSSIKLAKMFEDLLDIGDYELVIPYIRLTEQSEAQKLMNATQEQVAASAGMPSGLATADMQATAPKGVIG